MKKKQNKRKISIDKLIVISLAIFFLVLFCRVSFLSLASVIDGEDIRKLVNNRNTRVEVLSATRGTIYDINNKVLSQNINSYTVIAYLSPKRSQGSSKLLHVVDKEETAAKLAPLINMSKEEILSLLNRENVYQVELGPGGRNISELTKEQIVELELSGIGFSTSTKRYYPNNDFLSYVIGYTVNRGEGIIGEMGIEGYFNHDLKGEDGSREYQKDAQGYKIPNTKEIVKNPVDGKDIYLTINSDIQMFVESAIKEQGELYDPSFMNINVMEAKTGKILASSAYPSFDPNLLNITNYLNPLTSFAYEPGSTMKIYTYMAAMEKGTYDGSAMFESGVREYSDGYDDDGNEKNVEISDWNDEGWGTISYDRGFTLSSNIGVASLLDDKINKYDLKAFYEKIGFGDKTNIFLPKESAGRLSFNNKIETVNAGFGQGISTTPIQNLQALTPLANDGYLLKPQIVEKIINPRTGEVEYQAKVQKKDKVVTISTVNRMKDLMYKAINGDKEDSVGYIYKVDGMDVIGKTGTAQIYDIKNQEYMKGAYDVIYSFAGMFPYNDPQIIIYASMKQPTYGANKGLNQAIKTIIEDIGKYYNINGSNSSYYDNGLEIKVDSLVNKSIDTVTNYYEERDINVKVIGDGDTVINHYPSTNQVISKGDNLLLFSNDINTVPDLIGFSYKEVKVICDNLGYDCDLNGYGYVVSQSIEKGALYQGKIVLELAPKFGEDTLDSGVKGDGDIVDE